MNFTFSKYHGAGNDFIIIDNRNYNISFSTNQVKYLCDRHLGIGADGLMLLNTDNESDFRMVYYNSDGNESTMCGNGGRCITAFASKLGIIKQKTSFIAIDGLHTAEIIEDNDDIKIVKLKMTDVTKIIKRDNYFLINTGSPHYVEFVKDVNEIDILTTGREIRYNKIFAPNGLNVNFVEILDNSLFVRTYERGVEDETLSCGTGVTASALAFCFQKDIQTVNIETKGGNLSVSFEKEANGFKNIFLQGPATFIFEGMITAFKVK